MLTGGSGMLGSEGWGQLQCLFSNETSILDFARKNGFCTGRQQTLCRKVGGASSYVFRSWN